MYFVGAATVVAMTGSSAFLWQLPASERYPLGFFIGAGIWHLLLFFFGLAGLYVWPVMATMTIAVAAASIPHLATCLQAASRSFPRGSILRDPDTRARIAIGLGVACVAAAFVLIRGLYPLGGHDYYMHYFSYLTEVARSGSLRPNAVWYHFYDSKGLSLFFLAMILTDPTAPGLVSALFVGVGACTVYAMLRYATGARLISLCGGLLYIIFFVIGNDELEKQHIPAGISLLGVVWISLRFVFLERTQRSVWVVALCAATVTTILITVELALLIVLYVAGFLIWFSWRRDWRRAIDAIGVISAVTLYVAALCGLNYAYTGLPLEHLLIEAWPFADVSRLRDWGVLYEVLRLHEAFSDLATTALDPTSASMMVAPHLPWSWRLISTFAEYLRLTVWWPLVIPAALFLPWRLWDGTARRLATAPYLRTLAALSWFFLCVVIMAVLAGRTEIDSFYRAMSLAYPFPLCLFLLMWHLALDPRGRSIASIPNLARVGITVGALTLSWPYASRLLARPELSWNGAQKIVSNSLSLATGRFSLMDAYQNQLGWIAKHDTGGIVPGIVMPWKIAGPRTPILSFHIHAYCMLPDCYVVMPVTFRLGKHWQTPYIVYSESPARAAEQLRADGVNFFFISMDLPYHGFGIYGITPLFSPQVIRQYLAVRWTDGHNYLLSWPGPDTTPIDEKFMAFYTKVHEADRRRDGVENLRRISLINREIFDYMEKHARDPRPFALPWCMNCSRLPRLSD